MSCNNPYKLKVGDDEVMVPCRICQGCRIDNRNYWVMRGRYEAFTQYKKGKCNSFCTLTYTPENMPICPDGRITLRKKDFQDFMKRARKWLKEKNWNGKFKYMTCGEYGGVHNMPHYHIIFFGIDNYTADEMLRHNWKLGITQAKALAGAHIRYTLKYMEKQMPYKERKKEEEKGYENQFILRSRGIGEELYKKMANENVYINSKIAYAPKYWRDKYGIPQPVFNTLKLQFQKNLCKEQKISLEKYLKESRIAREFNLYAKTILDGRPAERVYRGLDRKAVTSVLAEKALKE